MKEGLKGVRFGFPIGLFLGLVLLTSYVAKNRNDIELQEKRITFSENRNKEQSNELYEMQQKLYFSEISIAKELLEQNGYGTGFDFDGLKDGNVLMYCYGFMEGVYKTCENNSVRQFEINADERTILINKNN